MNAKDPPPQDCLPLHAIATVLCIEQLSLALFPLSLALALFPSLSIYIFLPLSFSLSLSSPYVLYNIFTPGPRSFSSPPYTDIIEFPVVYTIVPPPGPSCGVDSKIQGDLKE